MIKSIEEPTPEDFRKKDSIVAVANTCIMYYQNIQISIEDIENDFQNASLSYRSPLNESLTDISILYNSLKGVRGDFSGFKEVSIYIHGIEDKGVDFFKSAVKAAKPGDIIILQDRKGVNTYVVIDFRTGKPVELNKLSDLKARDEYINKMGRLHISYETEHPNEHRQETSDDLAKRLNQLGLMTDNVKIDLFGHSYGGRRSLQFATDYPDKVKSITTIGTPYKKNLLGQSAHRAPLIGNLIGNNPQENSNYQDSNPENQRKDGGRIHSNVYSDMSSEAMDEDIDKLKVINPGVYDKLKEMEITAVAGNSVIEWGNNKTVNDGDDVVSLDSQHGKNLGDLIDKRKSIQVYSEGIKNPGHLHEITDEEFIDIIKEVNQ